MRWHTCTLSIEKWGRCHQDHHVASGFPDTPVDCPLKHAQLAPLLVTAYFGVIEDLPTWLYEGFVYIHVVLDAQRLRVVEPQSSDPQQRINL